MYDIEQRQVDSLSSKNDCLFSCIKLRSGCGHEGKADDFFEKFKVLRKAANYLDGLPDVELLVWQNQKIDTTTALWLFEQMGNGMQAVCPLGSGES